MYYYSFSYLAISSGLVEGDSCGFISEKPASIDDFKTLIKIKRPFLKNRTDIQILASKNVTEEEYKYFYSLSKGL